MTDDIQYPKLTQAELNDIIRKHQMFLTARPGGGRAVVRDKDLSNLSFAGQNLSQADFTGCIMSNCDMTSANFESATLFGCDLNQSKMVRTRFNRADLRGAAISNADLVQCDMTGADLREGKTFSRTASKNGFGREEESRTVQFTSSDLSRAVLTGASAQAADFTDTIMDGVKMQDANLKGATLKGADLSNVDLSGSDIRDADFSYAIMTGAVLEGVEKNGSNFTLTLTGEPVGKDIAEHELTLDELVIRHINWVATGGKQGKQFDLHKTDMRKAGTLSAKRLTAVKATESTFAEMDLRGIEMQSAILDQSDFRKSLLSNADLRASSFKKGLFNRADLSNANLNPLSFKKPDGIQYNIPSRFDEASMRHVNFSGARLREVQFQGADLTEANFTDCDLRGAVFTGAILQGAVFDGAMLENAVFDPK